MKTKSALTVFLALVVAATNLFAALKEGDLVQGSVPGVFIIRDGKRYVFTSPEQFNAMGFQWETIIKMSDADLNDIPQGPDVAAPKNPTKPCP